MRNITFEYYGEVYQGIVVPDKSFYGNYKVISDNMILSYKLIEKQIIKIDMLLREQISKDYMKAFKERNPVAKTILSVVKGEIQTIEKNKVKELLLNLLSIINVIDAPQNIINKALHANFNDIEDALQVYTALHFNMDCFITSDKKLKKETSSTLPILSPSDYVKEFLK